MTNPKKTRNQSPLEYLESLKQEWWVANLRRKIYPLTADKRHYSKVANLKKARIIEIYERNELPVVFDSPAEMKELNKQFAQKGGMPVFAGQTDTDRFNYYYPDSDVRCFYGFDAQQKPVIKLGKVHLYQPTTKKVQVAFQNGEMETLEIQQVSRIF